jgi:hypothetical protein
MLARVKVLLAKMWTIQSARKKRNVRDGSSLSDSCHSCGVAPHRWLDEISPSRTIGKTCSFLSRGCDESSSLLSPLTPSWAQ